MNGFTKQLFALPFIWHTSMKNFLEKLSIRQSIVFLFGLLLAASILNYLITSSNFDALSQKKLQLNIISLNRTLSHRILLESEQVLKEQPEAKDRLRLSMNEYQKRLNLALHGGRDLKLTNGIKLDPADEEEKVLIAEVENIWKPYKAEIEVLLREPLETDSSYEVKTDETLAATPDSSATDSTSLASSDSSTAEPTVIIKKESVKVANPSIRNAFKIISGQQNDLFKRIDKVSSLFSQKYENIVDTFGIILFILMLFNASLIVWSYIFVQGKLLRPLQRIEETADKIAQGDLNISLEYNRNNEIGKVARAINNLSENLRNATDFIRSIGEGKLDTRLAGIEDESNIKKDSLTGALVLMREQMKKVAEDERQRNWATEGLAKFVDIFRANNENIQQFSNDVLINVVEYVKANQGGFFLLNNSEEKPFLELTAAYAFNRQKHIEQRIDLGEGLVGQCFLEKQTIYLLNIPDEYVRITSGLGGSNPRCLLIVPLKIDKDVLGVMELASFQPFKPHEIAFMEKLAENIASTVATVKINQRTQQLLEESQMMTEQTRAQEEEMRQNMEEMEATQEEMARKEDEMRRMFEETQVSEQQLRNRLEQLKNELANKEKAVLAAQTEAKIAQEEAQNYAEKLAQELSQLREKLETLEAEPKAIVDNTQVESLQAELAESQAVLQELHAMLAAKEAALAEAKKVAENVTTAPTPPASNAAANMEIQILTMNNQAQKELYESRIKNLEDELKRLKSSK